MDIVGWKCCCAGGREVVNDKRVFRVYQGCGPEREAQKSASCLVRAGSAPRWRVCRPNQQWAL